MKIHILAISAMAFAMASCSQDSLFPDNGNGQSGKGTHLTLVGNASQQSRISIGEKTGDTYPVLWSEGDALGIFSKTAGADIMNVQSTVTKESVGKNTGTFASDDVKLAATGATDLLIYYPYSVYADILDDGNKITSSISDDQKQSKPGDSEHIGKYSFAYAKSTVDSPDGLAKFSLKHAMAYVKFVINSQEFSTYKLTSVALCDKDGKTPLSGSFTVDLDSGELTYGSDTKEYAMVTLENPELLSSTQEVYLTAFPADLSGKDVYVAVTMENDAQTVTIPVKVEGKQLSANAVNIITISDLKLSDNSCEWYEPVETRLLVGGWAYGEANCLVISLSSKNDLHKTMEVKARGNFVKVQEPKYTNVVVSSDLNVNYEMVAVNDSYSKSAMTPINSDYTIKVTSHFVKSYNGGCGQIAIYGEDKKTMLWTFIIWMTPKPTEHTYASGYVVLDRNLGSYYAGDKDDWKNGGVYFQWGRTTFMTWTNNGVTREPTAATSIDYSIENPRKMLYSNSVTNSNGDWYLGAWTGARSDRKDDLWGNPNESGSYLNTSDGHKSIYDPCPKGYRVVSPAVLNEVEKNAELETRSKTAVLKYCYDGTNYAYWPLAGSWWGTNGYKSGTSTGGNQDNTGLKTTGAACYWSNSPSSGYGDSNDQGATCLYYKVKDKSYTHSVGRAYAHSIRCMKDTENR